MKTLITITVFLLSITGFCQSKYEQAMQKAFDLWQENKLDEAVNMFERISGVEKENWLPPYYAAQVTIIKGFQEKDEIALKDMMNAALTHLNEAKTRNIEANEDIIMLEAQYYTVFVAFDGQKYGMQYAGKVTELYEKAYTIAPENPRVILSRAEWNMGSARFFGKSVTPYCKEIEKAITLFKDFTPKGQFYPTYGEERAKDILKNSCGE